MTQKLNHWLAATIRDLESIDTLRQAFERIMQGEATPAQIGSFLTALHLTQKDQDPDVIAKCAAVLRSKAVPVPALRQQVVDIVGTGGDGFDTFNASTAAGLVAAGCGLAVAKVLKRYWRARESVSP